MKARSRIELRLDVERNGIVYRDAWTFWHDRAPLSPAQADRVRDILKHALQEEPRLEADE